MRSLEILEITHNYIPNIYRGSEKVSGEVMPMGMLTEIREFDVLLTDDNCENPVHLDLLDSAGIPVEGVCSCIFLFLEIFNVLNNVLIIQNSMICMKITFS